MEYVCTSCAAKQRVDPAVWRCPACNGIFDLAERRPFAAETIEKRSTSLWRYRHMFGLPAGAASVSMGEGVTPLVPASFGGKTIHFKLEYLAPSGSFKDRGTSILVTALRALGVTRAADDSSGNAGASFAAYAAHAGLRAEVFAPAHASPAKLAQIEVFGATLHRIEGPRAKTTEALEAAAKGDLVYASHAWSPFTLEGTKTMAYEIWEQLGREVAQGGAPDVFICPIGQGSLFLGAYRGFKDLFAAGLIRKLPRLIGVQSVGCAPIVEALRLGLDRAASIDPQASVAEGIMLVRPLRDREILQALRETDGFAVAVPDVETLRARKELARIGLYVEPTSAVVGAALLRLPLEGTIVAALTGSGLKSGS
jgi:threonine synthase